MIHETEQNLLIPVYKELFSIPYEIQNAELKFRGGNKKSILFITVDEGVPSFNAPIEEMLARMLTNLKASEDDIVLLDVNMNDGTSFSVLKKTFNPSAIIFFGGKFSTINLQVELAKNNKITMNGISLMEALSFSQIEKSPEEKKAIFPALKKIFSI